MTGHAAAPAVDMQALAEMVTRLGEQVAALTTTVIQQREERREEEVPTLRRRDVPPVRRHDVRPGRGEDEAFLARRQELFARRVAPHQAGRQHLRAHRGPTRRTNSYIEDELEVDEEYHIGEEHNHYDYRVKAHIPLFYGTMGIEEFLDWQTEVDRFFEVMKVPESKQVKMVAIQLKSVASIWWDKIVIQRQKQHKEPIRTWMRMRQMMRDRFFPKELESKLYMNQYLQNNILQEDTTSKLDEDSNATIEVRDEKTHHHEELKEKCVVEKIEENIFKAQQIHETVKTLSEVDETEKEEEIVLLEAFIEDDPKFSIAVQPSEDIIATAAAFMLQEDKVDAHIFHVNNVGVTFEESKLILESIDMVMPYDLIFQLDGKLRICVIDIYLSISMFLNGGSHFQEENSGSSSSEVEESDAGAFLIDPG